MMPAPIIRATLDGDTATAGNVSARGATPVLALCRKLIEAGFDPESPLHVFRGNVLALSVRTIGHGAQLTVREDGTTPRFAKWRPYAGPTRMASKSRAVTFQIAPNENSGAVAL